MTRHTFRCLLLLTLWIVFWVYLCFRFGYIWSCPYCGISGHVQPHS